jgi:hypothetical protein
MAKLTVCILIFIALITGNKIGHLAASDRCAALQSKEAM